MFAIRDLRVVPSLRVTRSLIWGLPKWKEKDLFVARDLASVELTADPAIAVQIDGEGSDRSTPCGWRVCRARCGWWS